ncbi:MAG TPA: 2OG-Fe(II) oxygenase [Solirubrobacteraceae bacterium]|nr:2OG-Fe(II) oxygenase [Solirubrobacteraceae bacterium]
MDVLDLLPRLGVFIKQDFFEASFRDELRAQMRETRDRPSPVGSPDGPIAVDEAQRKSRLVDLPETACGAVSERLLAVQPEVEQHFGDRYTACRPPQFLLYGPGHYHKPHVDWYDEEQWERRVSMLTFLNGESADEEDADSFTGGALVLYGLFGDRARDRGIPISGRPGMLVGFRADTIHEVSPVTRGRRYCTLSWLVP